jgi:hypothetical protein
VVVTLAADCLLQQGEDNVSVSVVTYRKGGTHEAVTAAARKLKAFNEKHGAGQLVVNAVVAGSDVGQWAFIITFPDWEAFGKAMKSASSDPEFAQVLSGLDAAAELVSRRIVMSVDL